MPIDLPNPIADYLAAGARFDVDGMVRPFAADALVTDNGKRYAGAAEIRRLFEEEVLPVRAVFTPEAARREADAVVVEGPVAGDFPGSPLRFTYRFTLNGEAIAALEIAL